MKLEKKTKQNKTKPNKQSKHQIQKLLRLSIRDATPDSYKVRPETL